MGLLDRLLVRGTISDVTQVARRMKRLRITGEAIKKLSPKPGQQVRVIVGELMSMDLVRNDAVRTYSVWDHSAAEGYLELCVLDHDHAGPGAKLARVAEPGRPILLAGPEGDFVLQQKSAAHVFFGEETAQVAFGAMLRALPSHATASGVVEVEHEGDALTLPGTSAITFAVRNGDVGNKLLAAALTLPLPEDATVYIAGEAKTCKAVRTILINERGVARRNVLRKPFWTPGAKGLE